jgi:hypothetical protein
MRWPTEGEAEGVEGLSRGVVGGPHLVRPHASGRSLLAWGAREVFVLGHAGNSRRSRSHTRAQGGSIRGVSVAVRGTRCESGAVAPL